MAIQGLFYWQKHTPARLRPARGRADCDGRAGTPPAPFFLGRKVENAWWKLGAPLRSSGVISLVRIAFFVAIFPQQKVQKITKHIENI